MAGAPVESGQARRTHDGNAGSGAAGTRAIAVSLRGFPGRRTRRRGPDRYPGFRADDRTDARMRGLTTSRDQCLIAERRARNRLIDERQDRTGGVGASRRPVRSGTQFLLTGSIPATRCRRAGIGPPLFGGHACAPAGEQATRCRSRPREGASLPLLRRIGGVAEFRNPDHAARVPRAVQSTLPERPAAVGCQPWDGRRGGAGVREQS